MHQLLFLIKMIKHIVDQNASDKLQGTLSARPHTYTNAIHISGRLPLPRPLT